MKYGGRYAELIRNTGFFALSDISTKLITFLMVPLYTYFLTEGEYGITDLATVTLSLVLPLTTLSITESVLRFCISDREHREDYVTLGIVVVLTSNLIVASLLPIFDLPFFGGLGRYKWYVLACYFGLSLQTLFTGVARGLDQVKLMSIAAVFSSLVNIVLALILVAGKGYGVDGFFIANLSGSAIGSAVLLGTGRYWRLVRRPQGGYRKRLARMLAYSLPLVPNALSWWINQSINRFFITSILGVAASGMFAAALKIPALLNLISAIFMQAWNLSAFKARGSSDERKLYSEVFVFYNAGMSVATGILVPLSPLLAGLILQKSFYSAWTLIPISMLAVYYSTVGAFFGSIYTANMKTKNLFVTTVFGSFVCIGATYALLQVFGLIGAAYATTLANFVVWVVRLIDTRRFLRIRVPIIGLVVTNVLLVFSAVFISSGLPYSIAVSVACSLLIMVCQGVTLLRAFRRRSVDFSASREFPDEFSTPNDIR